ncbi:MAG: hypothetical protein GXP39_15565 [Chloroflexi bacterium]|nr:hypothetical protein [Chloroflexota bacterium]
MTRDEDRDRVTTRMRWIAQVWSIPIIAYALLMLIGYAWNWVTLGTPDPYAVEGYPLIEALPPIFMFLSILGLGIARRWELAGGAIAVAFLLATILLLIIRIPITRDFPRSAIPYVLSATVATPGVLFLICGWRSRKGTSPA